MSSPNLDEEFAPFFTVEAVIIQPLASLSLAFFGYGIYTVIFGLCLHTLWCRRDRPHRKMFLGCIISLFLMNTLMMVFETWQFIRQAILDYTTVKSHNYDKYIVYLYGDPLKTVCGAVLNVSAIMIPIIADLMLIHRCYVVWGNNKRMAIFLLFLFIVSNGWAIADNIINAYTYSDTGNPALLQLLVTELKVDVWHSLVFCITNIIITVLTAFRIWWITREARKLMGGATRRQYKRIIMIILESGALFPAGLIAAMIMNILSDYDVLGIEPIDLNTPSYQLAGIAPTLVIIRLARGQAVESVDQVMSTLAFADNLNDRTCASTEHRSGSSRTQTVDIEQAIVGEESEAKL